MFFFYFLQVSDTFDNVIQTAAQADNMFMDASTTIQRANSVGMYNRQTASDLLNRATNAANLSQQYLEVRSRDYPGITTMIRTTSSVTIFYKVAASLVVAHNIYVYCT